MGNVTLRRGYRQIFVAGVALVLTLAGFANSAGGAARKPHKVIADHPFVTVQYCGRGDIHIAGRIAFGGDGKMVLQEFYGGAWHRRWRTQQWPVVGNRYDIVVNPHVPGVKTYRPVWLFHGRRLPGPSLKVTVTLNRVCEGYAPAP